LPLTLIYFMADFELFFPLIVKDEQLTITDDPNDSGHYSVAGISSRDYPNDPAILKAKALYLKAGEWSDELLPLVKDFYRKREWNLYAGDHVISQEAVNTIGDRGVNIGSGESIKMTQRQVGVPDTGVMDDATILKINELNPYA
jgi:lysozyme family protein